MARPSFRAPGPTESRSSRRAGRALVLSLLAAAPGCVSYAPAPVDPAEILARAEALRLPEPEPGTGVDALALSAFAVTHAPALRAARAALGVERALLVEAGLLADPEIGWDAMDVLAAQLVDGTSGGVEVLSGLGISIPVPRPGERAARIGAAEWKLEAGRRRVAEAEWRLALEVHLACEDVLEAEQLLAQNEELLEIARTTDAYFARARAAGAATAIQASLAAGDLLAVRAEHLRLEGVLRAARQDLNARLGLSPTAAVPLVARAPAPEPESSPEELVRGCLAARPDLAVLLAAYESTEQAVRLEVARQLPALSIGTGLWLELGLGTRFNRPAIDTALARRAELAAEIEGRVHEIRREVHAARAALESAHERLSFLEDELLPNAEASLNLATQAFGAGEVTVLEILGVQHGLIDARTRVTAARAELQRARWRLLAASGALLSPSTEDPTPAPGGSLR